MDGRTAWVWPAAAGPQEGSRAPLRWLLHEILAQDSLHGPQALLRTVAHAAGATGALLWKEAGDRPAAAPSIVALWSEDGSARPAPPTADWFTVEALLSRTATIPSRDGANPPNDRGVPVMAALPVSYPDGLRGALTLLGDAQLAPDAAGAVLDLLDVLPDLSEILRERQSLGLVRACNDVLNAADVEASGEPLARDRLGGHLAEVCAVVARALGCRDVSVFLRDPEAAADTYELLASSVPDVRMWSSVRAGVGPVGRAIVEGRPAVGALPEQAPAAQGDGPARQAADTLMVVPLRSGQQVWGAIACSGPACGFTGSDLALVAPIAPQVAQYWGDWLHRRTIFAENESWRALAAGVTDINRLLFKEMRHAAMDDCRVYNAALRMIQRVLPESDGCDVRRSEGTSSSDRLLRVVCATGAAGRRPRRTPHGVVTPLAADVLQSRDQRWTTNPAEIRAEGIGGRTRWLVCSPIRVDEEPYGVLNVYGESPALPPNSRQVCTIVADQLGLYQRLKQARGELEDMIQAQAAAMEDLQHQLVSPLLVAVNRTDKMLDGKGLNGRVDTDVRSVRAVRGLCRQASRVAMSAQIFAALSTGRTPSARPERLTVDEVIRAVIAGADDAQLLGDARRGVRFEVDRDSIRRLGRGRIKADPSFLEQCLGNLLDNAAKYSYEGTRVVVRGMVGCGEFAVAVTSTGLSMTADEARCCLDRAWRGAAAASVTGEGSGLGLWIVDNLMRSMGGAVRIRCEEDRTTVLLAFPLPP
ncbi:MAG TPA: GAF domain-containing protein [Micromonosporaceae bacterium]|nr:GAF domain-containing protein [Micromonosporaceae bacterium]